jgi:hypothetical protein
VADRFAVIALAGEMAIAYGLLPWEPGTALADCRCSMANGSPVSAEGMPKIARSWPASSTLSTSTAAAAFSDVDAPEADTKVFNRAGYWEVVANKRLFLFNKSALIEAAHGFGLTRVIKALEVGGALAKRDTDRDSRKTKKYRIPPADLRGCTSSTRKPWTAKAVPPTSTTTKRMPEFTGTYKRGEQGEQGNSQ